jgi:alanyl-tRNA synthetase
MEYSRDENGLSLLPKKCIDTGMGLERVLSILRGVRSNYLTDLFSPLFDFIENEGELEPYRDGLYGDNIDVAYRVLADHSRTIAVCLHYGVEFSSEGRGYVLRRIMRRALRYSNEILRLKQGTIGKLVGLASRILGCDLSEKKIDSVHAEESLFMRTLERGIVQFNKMTKGVSGVVSGEDAFVLYDTYGFPVDLTEIMAKEKGLKVNLDEFEELKSKAKELSRGGLSKKESKSIALNVYDLEKLDGYKTTDDSFKYYKNHITGSVIGIVDSAGLRFELEKESGGDEVGVLVDKTCFYAECGGQIGDIGNIWFFDGEGRVGSVEVKDTQSFSGYVLHIGRLEGRITKDALLIYDEKERERIMRNHTATHILNYALRKILGKGVEQRGSLVCPDKLRFDFVYGSQLAEKQIIDIEDLMNHCVSEGSNVETSVVRHNEIEDDGVVFLKNESYPEMVRLVSLGESKELCGGTHVRNTSHIKRIRIVSESSISSNTRRIVAVSGEDALSAEEYFKRTEKKEAVTIDSVIPLMERNKISELMKVNEKERMAESKKRLNMNLEELRKMICERRDAKGNGRLVVFKAILRHGNITKQLIKELNVIAGVFDKEKVEGLVYFVEEREIFYSIRASDALGIADAFSRTFANKANGGGGKCANGRGTLSSNEDLSKGLERIQ